MEKNGRRIANVRNENETARRSGAGNGRDMLVRPQSEMWLSTAGFIGVARQHLRDQPYVPVTVVTSGLICSWQGENGLMFRLEHCAICSNWNIRTLQKIIGVSR
jgi:hypothetical protein